MNWVEIISLLVNALLGTGMIIQFLNIRSLKQEAVAKADSAKAQAGKDNVGLVNDTVTTMVNTVNSLMAQNKELIDRYVSKSDELEKVQAEKSDLEQKFTELEKRVNRMIQTNLKVIKALETLGVDEEIIKTLKENKP